RGAGRRGRTHASARAPTPGLRRGATRQPAALCREIPRCLPRASTHGRKTTPRRTGPTLRESPDEARLFRPLLRPKQTYVRAARPHNNGAVDPSERPRTPALSHHSLPGREIFYGF